MRTRWIVPTSLVLLLAGALPASAQMMGGGGPKGMGMMGGMGTMGPGMHEAAGAGGCPGMGGQPIAFNAEAPWIGFALAHAKDLGLTAEQVEALDALRAEFQTDAAGRLQGIRAAEVALDQLLARAPVDLAAIEAKVREIAGLRAELRIARIKTIQKGVGLLTEEQRQKLFEASRAMGRMMGASLSEQTPATTQ